jgi:hypothetical protein
MVMKGFTVEVLAGQHKCTNGPTSLFGNPVVGLTLVGGGLPKMFTPSHTHPLMKLVRRECMGKTQVLIEPMLRGEDGSPIIDTVYSGRFMFGGQFAHSSDSRFREATGLDFNHPIPIHDRYEPYGEYDRYEPYGEYPECWWGEYVSFAL